MGYVVWEENCKQKFDVDLVGVKERREDEARDLGQAET